MCIRCRSNRPSWQPSAQSFRRVRCRPAMRSRSCANPIAAMSGSTRIVSASCLLICWKTARLSVIHCTAGKDRTGFACALVLHALGVPEKVIGEDYLLTNRFYRRDPNSAPDLPDRCPAGDRIGRASFLAAGFDAVNAQYGDLEGYFRDGLGLGARRSAPSSRSAIPARAAGRYRLGSTAATRKASRV